MTTSNSIFPPNHPSDHHRHSRRRWVIKGVMLLIVLFVVGLLSARQNTLNDTALAEIVVPGTRSTADSCDAKHIDRNLGYAVVSCRETEWTGPAGRSNLKTF